MKLFACMCNQPQAAIGRLAPVRPVLLARPAGSALGLGYIQGGDVLLVRTPKSEAPRPVDSRAPLAEIATDCAIGQAVDDERFGGTDNTPPFRFRRWMFAHAGTPASTGRPPACRARSRVPAPQHQGPTPGELVFHVFLAMLHDEGSIDNPNRPRAATRRALAATMRLVATEHAEGSADRSWRSATSRRTNGRSMVVARLARAAAPAPAVGQRRSRRAR